MNNTNQFLQDYLSVAQRARELELQPLPDDTNTRTLRNLVLIVLGFVLLYMGVYTYYPPVGDFSDSGVGCTDDCLDSMKGEKP